MAAELGPPSSPAERTAPATKGVPMTPVRHRVELTHDEALRMVGSVPFGRIAFSSGALPAIQPASHILAGDQVIIRAALGAAFSSAVRPGGMVVAYQADLFDPVSRLGWSVTLIGTARPVASEKLAARYRKSLRPWTDEEMDDVIAIGAELVTGFRIVPVPAGELAFSATLPAESLPVFGLSGEGCHGCRNAAARPASVHGVVLARELRMRRAVPLARGLTSGGEYRSRGC
jgi:hypothetical protein